MYTPDLSTASTLAATGMAAAWDVLAAGVLLVAGVTTITIAKVLRHRKSKA